MRGVILLGIIFAFVTLACGAGDELPTLAPTAVIQEVEPPATATDTPGAEEELTDTPEPTDTPSPTDTPEIICSAPRCNEDEILFCPDECPNGCGTLCVTVTPTIPGGQEAQVVEIIDGDTIDVDIDGKIYRVRYIGMDTPERGMPFFDEATEANSDLVAEKTVILVKDVSETDQFNRLLRYVYLEDGRMVNAELVRLGYAQQATYPPDVAHQDLFNELMQEARESEVGLWAIPPTNTPAPPTNTPIPQPTNTPIPLPTNTPVPQPTDTQPPPPPPTEPPQAAPPAQNCDPSYPTVCIPPYPPDLDCGEIPYRRFQVNPPDPHGFDGDNDGVGCESG